MSHTSHLTSRRRFLASTAVSSTLLLGCQPQPSAAPKPSAVRSDVPLRILLCGTDRWRQTLTTAWTGIAEQPLDVHLLNPAMIDAAQWQTQVTAALARCDVAIVTAGLLPAIQSVSGLTAPNEQLLGEEGIDASTLYPVLREGLMKYGGRTVAVPLGAVQPTLVMRTDSERGERQPPHDWASFIAVAKELPPAQVAEPLAGGAAGRMFLWRANAANPPVWLFDRESFAPVIATRPYIDVLENMSRCAAIYGDERLTPGEVWARIATGKLQMAIAWPAARSELERIEEPVACAFSPLPKADQPLAAVQPTLVDHESPVAIVSSHCRQSEAAKRFLVWLVDGEGTGMIRDSVTGLTPLRGGGDQPIKRTPMDSTSDAQEPSAQAATSTYAAQAARVLSVSSLRPPLQLLEYRPYADALDAAVLSCLDGKQTAQAALEKAAQTWTELTQQIGIQPQQQAWRRAQGLSG